MCFILKEFKKEVSEKKTVSLCNTCGKLSAAVDKPNGQVAAVEQAEKLQHAWQGSMGVDKCGNKKGATS